MFFESNINAILGKYLQTSFNDYRYYVLAGQAVYLEGHAGVVSFNTDNVIFRLKKKLLTVSGKNLCIAEFDKTTAVIVGEVESVAVR